MTVLTQDWAAPTLYRQTGQIWPVGVPTSLTWYDVGALLHTIQAAHVEVVVEIGVEQGGLAALLLAACHFAMPHYGIPPLRQYFGVDIALHTLADRVLELYPDRFLEADAWDSTTMARVAQEIAPYGRALIFCDGGDKPKDLRTYADVARSGDLLLAHDYRHEYHDAAFADLPPTLERLTPIWLEETLLCLFWKH